MLFTPLDKGLKEPLPCSLSVMLSKTLKKAAGKILEPLGKGLGKIGIKPNHITVMGVILTFCAAWLLYNQNIYYAFLIGMVACLFDGADGLVARATKFPWSSAGVSLALVKQIPTRAWVQLVASSPSITAFMFSCRDETLLNSRRPSCVVITASVSSSPCYTSPRGHRQHIH